MKRYSVVKTSQFKKDLKLSIKRNKPITKLDKAIDVLTSGDTLPIEYKEHILIGNFKGIHECHIENDWLLLFEFDEEKLRLILHGVGTHSDLF